MMREHGGYVHQAQRRWGSQLIAIAVVLVCGLSMITAIRSTDRAAAASLQRQKGIDIYTVGGDTATILTQAKLTFDYCKSLGANAVSLNFPFAVSGLTANDPHAIPGVTPSPDLLAQMIPLATADGLSVQLRPLLDESNLIHGWRGTLAPTQPSTWFSNYSAFLQPYLAMATASNVGSFYISSELDAMVSKYRSKWVSLVAQARQVFAGPIYAATSHQSFLPSTSVTEAYDDYDPAFVDDSASIGTLTRWLKKDLVADKVPGPPGALVLSEVGIAAAHGAYVWPYQFNFKPPVIRSIQSNWFTAMCNTMFDDHLGGIYFWVLFMSTFSPTEKDTSQTTGWVGTGGGAAIKACFARSS